MTAEPVAKTSLFSLPKQFGAFPIVRQWIPKSTTLPGRLTSRTGKLVLDGFSQIVIGDTGWLGLTARDAANDVGQAYGHFLVDDSMIIECIPALTGRAGYIEQARFIETRAGTGNLDALESALAINLCFGGAVKGPDCFEKCVGLVAFACWWFGLDPGKDIRRAADLDPARKDPGRALAAASKEFPELIDAVRARMPAGETGDA
jgi:hypothetical protein